MVRKPECGDGYRVDVIQCTAGRRRPIVTASSCHARERVFELLQNGHDAHSRDRHDGALCGSALPGD
jgi:hypothetical protein